MPTDVPPVILTIDDEKAIRESFKNFLEDYDYVVFEAENGRVGLEVFEREKPDLVLVDLRMPEMDGLGILARIHKTSPGTPVIVASGTGLIADAIEALRLGACDYLLKPVEDLNVLLHAVEKALERSRLIRENKSYQEHLEQEVVNRTRELETANARLKETNIRLQESGTKYRGLFENKKALEAQLLQAHKLEAIGTLAGGIAHDFNNILSAVIGYAEIAGLELSEDNHARKNLRKVVKAGERAKDLVSQILSFSRQAEIKRQPMRVTPVIEETLKLMRASLPATIEIKKTIETVVDTVNANSTQIHQVVMNLCTNAAYAMQPKGGVLEVKLTKIDIDETAALKHVELSPGPYLKLIISDTGTGMTPEVMERIFTPYFTTREKGAGTGLGLPVVHGIIKSHGGVITVDSKPGKGTNFTTLLPCQTEALESRPAHESEVLARGSGCVLFVDDEVTLTEIAGEMLGHMGYEAVTSTGSHDALKLFRRQPERFDLVITDMTMPGMTGDILSRELLKIRPDIPILLCSGYSEESAAQKAHAIGTKGFIKKPITMFDLARKIKAALDTA